MKPESWGSVEEPGKEAGSVQQEPRTCPICGTKFFATADSEFCPVCVLHRAFGAESSATGASGSASGLAASPGDTEGKPQVRRFENYEVMLDADGRPIELGRGAMGVTYKALDVDLRCPVTLKVISTTGSPDGEAPLPRWLSSRGTSKRSKITQGWFLILTESSFYCPRAAL
jgi:hypothetical protein